MIELMSWKTQPLALNQGNLSQELHQSGRTNAHKLVGALGSFGFSEGSRLARELEQLLQKSASLDSQDASRFLELVQQLRQSLSESSKQEAQNNAVRTIIQGAPLLLIVSNDQPFSDALQAAAKSYQFRTQIIKQLAQVATTIHQTHPQIILLDSKLLSTDFEQLRRIIPRSLSASTIKVLVMDENPTLEGRLAIVQQGGNQILERSSPPHHLIEAAAQTLQTMTAKAKVGIVDDDKQFLTAIKTSLEPWGFQLITLDRANRLWETLEQEKLNVLVLDVEMPGINGLELCQVLRADPRWHQIPILFLTVHQDAKTRAKAFEAGADDYIDKSVATTELATRILNRLKHQQVSTQPIQ